MIKIRDVCKSFGSHEALKHINLDIVEGETLAIIGGSGSGKRTVVRYSDKGGGIWNHHCKLSDVLS